MLYNVKLLVSLIIIIYLINVANAEDSSGKTRDERSSFFINDFNPNQIGDLGLFWGRKGDIE